MKNYDAVLDLWAEGLSSNKIRTRLGYKSVSSVAYILKIAREVKDPRAYYRNPPWSERRIKELRRKRLVIMFPSSKQELREVTEKLGCRNELESKSNRQGWF